MRNFTGGLGRVLAAGLRAALGEPVSKREWKRGGKRRDAKETLSDGRMGHYCYREPFSAMYLNEDYAKRAIVRFNRAQRRRERVGGDMPGHILRNASFAHTGKLPATKTFKAQKGKLAKQPAVLTGGETTTV
jgi:hypothetical protein